MVMKITVIMMMMTMVIEDEYCGDHDNGDCDADRVLDAVMMIMVVMVVVIVIK